MPSSSPSNSARVRRSARLPCGADFVDERRDQLRAMSDRLQAEKEAAGDLDRRIEEQRELRAELISMKIKTARADRAKTVLEGSVFDNCPNCGQSLSTHRPRPENACYVCLQPIGIQSDQDLTVTAIRSDLDARIGDIEASLRRHTAARRRQLDRVEELTVAKARKGRRTCGVTYHLRNRPPYPHP
jgi:hypothetical protein